MRLDSDTICEADGYLGYRESHSECVGTSSHTRIIQRSCAVRTIDVRSKPVTREDLIGGAEQYRYCIVQE